MAGAWARMRDRAWRLVVAAPLAAGLAACGDDAGVGDVGTLWGAESRADREAREALEARRRNKVPMQTVTSVEIGRTAAGILLTAFGTAPGPGYSLPALRVRRDGKPSGDGYLEFDLVATEPAPGAAPTAARNLDIRADLPIDMRALRGVAGLRVMSLTSQVQVNF